MKRKHWINSIVIGGAMASLLVVMTLWFTNPSFQAILEPSFFFKQGLYPILLFLLSWLFFTLLTMFYERIDFRLPGSKGFKATLYVISELLIIFLYVSEPLPHRVDLDWILNPLKLLILFMLQGKLIQHLLVRERLMYRPKPFFYTRGLLVYMITFILFRLIIYLGFNGYQVPQSHLGISVMWSGIMGLAIGLSFSTLQRYLIRQDQKGKANLFALQFFALLSIGYHVFIILSYDVSWLDMITRCALDIFAVWLATFIILYFQINEKSELSSRPFDEGA